MTEDRIPLLAIRDAVERILSYTTSGEDQFGNDRFTQDAVARNVVVVGRALQNLPDGFRTRHANVALERLCAVCDAVTNECLESHLDLIWNAIQVDLPALLNAARVEIDE